MPGFNGAGPMGNGPMTGRKMGKCTNFGASRKNNPETDPPTEDFMGRPGRGFNGRGRGMALKHKNRFGRNN